MMEAIKAVFKAYFVAELLRSGGLIYSILSMSFWMILFILPMVLFAPPGVDKGLVAGYAFTAILVFMSYSIASWDWGYEIRWLMRINMLEYIIASGRSIFILYFGIIPMTITWLAVMLGSVYVLLSALMAPPEFHITDPLLLVYSLILLAVVLFAHAMFLGGTTISMGTSGPVIEIITWILPLSTGGLVPLKNMPEPVARFALYTPYSYPAELIRHFLLGTETICPVDQLLLYGSIYALLFLIAGLLFFKYEFKKMLREGVKTIGMY